MSWRPLHRKMMSIHGDKYKVDLAMALLSLVQHGFAYQIPAEELVNMADECLQHIRVLAEINPLAYTRQLANVL
jgi:hypothetical protein